MCAVNKINKGARRDYADLRDYVYTPGLAVLPAEHMPWDFLLSSDGLSVSVREQGKDDGSCVGQALAALIDIQLKLRKTPVDGRVSAAMLYSMGRYHDLPADVGGTGISSPRAAIKAFFHHGACLDMDSQHGGWPDGDLERDWPSEQQSAQAADRTLGAYSRLQPILHHYHSAVFEAGAVLVTAQLHGGWDQPQPDGVIKFQEPDAKPPLHAFVIVGYNSQGFLILNSWGADWGGVPTGGGRIAPGLAIWTYADWARCIDHGWVLRLGVPGKDVMSIGAEEQGIGRTRFGEASRTIPYRELRGHFLNLDVGRWQDRGAYATPMIAAHDTVARIKGELDKPECRGLVLSLPGIMDSEDRILEKALKLKRRLEPHNLEFLTCLWSANFAAEMRGVLHDIFTRCRTTAGESSETLDSLFEETARGAGRAFWREVVRQAYCAALPCDPDAGLWQQAVKAPCREDRGQLGIVFQELLKVCAEKGKPMRLLADGAGALVLDGLLTLAGQSGNTDTPLPGLGRLVMTFAAVPLDQAKERILPLARAMERRAPGSAVIIVPDPDLEKRITSDGYGRSMLQLVSRSFLDRDTKAMRRPMLGTARAALPFADGDDLSVRSWQPDDAEPPFEMFSPSRSFRLDQGELDANPELASRVLQAITGPVPPDDPVHPPHPSFPLEESNMTIAQYPKITLQELQERMNRGQLSAEESLQYFVPDEQASGPFSPVMVINHELVEMPANRSRSALALNSANAAARFRRLGNYYARIGQGYDGPRIAAEGDSWTQYPLRLRDVIDYVAERYAVFDTSAAGDLLDNMARKREYIDALKQSQAEILLLSAGGNDVCAGGALEHHLERFSPELSAADYLKRSYQGILDSAIASYEKICRDVNEHFPQVRIIVHGYDYVIPNDGRWLGKPMAKCGITDRKLQRAIAAEMIDQFNRALRRMAAGMAHVHYVDCRKAVADDRWFDELHPDNGGFAKVAERILTKIQEITRAGRPRDGDIEQVLTKIIDTDAARHGDHDDEQIPDGQQNRALSLHVGLNAIDPDHYAGSSGILYGCENDARAMRDLAEAQGYDTTIRLTTEATRAQVIEDLRRAAAKLHEGDHFLFTVACHGNVMTDLNGDEAESGNQNRDSTLCLYDSQIIDDELWDIFAEFRSGVRIVMVADSCHSGTVARNDGITPIVIGGTGTTALLPVRPRTLSSALSRQVEAENIELYAQLARAVPHVNRQILTTPAKTRLKASIIQFSACRDDQTAADGDDNGLFTAALLRIWDKGKFEGSYDTFMRRLQGELAGTNQTPGLFVPAPVEPTFLRQRPFTVPKQRQRTRPKDAYSCKETLRPQPQADSGAMLLGDEAEDRPTATRGTGRPRRDAPHIPAKTVERFRDFMAQQSLKHFRAEEFLELGAAHSGGGAGHGLNTAPPESKWTNIVPTAKVLDMLRERLDAPIRITSAYRSPDYNEAIGGAAESWHVEFRACDFIVEGVPAPMAAKALRKLRDEGHFRGGIGQYDSFTHVDTRGTNVDWPKASKRSADSTQSPEIDRLRRFADTIVSAPRRSRPRQGEADQLDQSLAAATAAVNGAQLIALSDRLSPKQRKAVLYSNQFAKRAADADADPLTDRANWWATYNAALAAMGWVSTDSVARVATAEDRDATLDTLALDIMAGLVGVDKLRAISAVLTGLKKLGRDDERLMLLDMESKRHDGGAIQIGEAELANGNLTMTTGAVQFISEDSRKQILFAKWGSLTAKIWLAADRRELNQDFYFGKAQAIVENRLSDAEARIMAFNLS